jgi:phosphoesterase RecJ-like protein
LYQALIKIGKKVTLICPHEIPENFKFLKGADKVKTLDFKEWKDTGVRRYDIFLILDSGSYDIVTGSKEILLPNIKKIVIDHHLTNNWNNCLVKLLDTKASATAEIVYKILLDWNVEIDKNISTSLLSGLAGDTVFFKYPKDPNVTFLIVNKLMKLGANYTLLISKLNDGLSFGFVKLLGEFINNMKKEKKFVWSAVSYDMFEKHSKPRGVRETAADNFFRSIKNADFGVALLEEEKGKISMSFRSKQKFDVSKIAEQFGGGGHINAAGGKVKGEFEKTVKKIIKKIKKVILV